MSTVPGDDGAPDPGHEGLPQKAVKRIHLLKNAKEKLNRHLLRQILKTAFNKK